MVLTMETEEAKKHCGRKEGDETNTLSVDRISELPDPLIHHILSYLPTYYAVRTSILSKHWRNMWIYVTFLCFEEFMDATFENMFKSRWKMFYNFVSNCLIYRKRFMEFSENVTFITRFKLEMQYRSGSIAKENVDNWLNIAVECNVKELDLYMTASSRACYPLTHSVLYSRSLTILKLKNLLLEISLPVSLPSLKALCLENVVYYNNSLQNLIFGCPIIEDLSHTALESPRHQNMVLVVGGTLRNLTLCGLCFTNQQLEGLVYGIPLLEKLTISSCSWMKNNIFHIRSHSLKSLFLHDYNIKVKLTTPNLVSFVFQGGVMSTILVFDAPNLLEANLKLKDGCLYGTSFHLILFLSYFKCLKKMVLSFGLKEDLIIPKDVRNLCCPPLPTLKHLKVKIHDALERNSELKDVFRWCAPSLETLEIE